MVLNKHQAQVARGELIVIQADAQQDYDFFLIWENWTMSQAYIKLR